MDNEYIEPYGFIYITTNLVNGKKYLGQKRFSEGWEEYLGSGHTFKKALKKYGRENFSRKIVCVCNSEEELNKAEYDLSVFLDVVNSDDWYNLCYGGGSVSGYKHTEEEKQKISESLKGKYTGKKSSFYGKHHTEETKAKISGANKGKVVSDETRKKLSEANKGKTISEESKRKMSDALKGENCYLYGKHRSEETKNKISETLKGKFVGENHPNARAINQYTKDGIFIRTWSCINEASKQLGINSSHISDCCRGKERRKSAGGFVWKYASEAHL